jgi:hypothetical protein
MYDDMYDEVRRRRPVLIFLDSTEIGEDLGLALFASIVSMMGRDLYFAMHDIRAGDGRSPLFRHRIEYAAAVIGVGGDRGHVHEALSGLRFGHDDVLLRFIAVSDRAAPTRVVSPTLSPMVWLEPYAEVPSIGHQMPCCDRAALRSYCELIKRRHVSNSDLHAFERRGSDSMRLLQRFLDECASPVRRWCVQDCTDEAAGGSIGVVIRNLALSIYQPAQPEPMKSYTIRSSADASAYTRILEFPARKWPVDIYVYRNSQESAPGGTTEDSTTSAGIVTSWWLLRSVTCCDAEGHLIMHSRDPNDQRVVETLTAVNKQPTIPSSTSYGTSAMPVRANSEPYDAASCTHIRNWTFVTMHGLCPSAEFQSGNYGHSLVDALAPMFYTLHLLAPILGPTQLDHLLVSLYADPPTRRQPRPANNCEAVAEALGFKRRAIHWDDFAMGRRRHCFDSLILGMDMNLALAGTYMSLLMHDDNSDSRVVLYAGFVRFIRAATAAFISSTPIPSNSSVRSALVVRVQSRRLVNEAEVCMGIARLLGSTPLVVAFERMSMRQMVEALAPIQLMVGMFSSGMINSMFMNSRGALLSPPSP